MVKKSRNSHLARALAAVAVVVIGGYFWYRGGTEQSSKRYPSRCIILSPMLLETIPVDCWQELLRHDTVLLVAKGVDVAFGPDMSHKVIRYETETGMWSCVRHLHKQVLVFNNIQDIPIDIPRYVGQILSSKEFIRSTII